MADDIIRGLEQVSPYEKAQAEYKAQIANLSKIQNDLMASLDSRQGAGNPFFALAQGFLAPTKGGGFGESAGNAMQMFGAQQQQQQKQDQETAMMRMQLAQASLAPAKEIYGMAREKAMGEALKTQLGGGANAGAGSSGATAGATGVGSVAGAGGVGGAGGAGVFGGMPETVRKAIEFRASYGDTAGAIDLRDKWEIENAKVPDEVKKVRMLSALLANPVAALTSFAQAVLEKPTLENEKLVQDAVIAVAQGGANIADIARRLPDPMAAIVIRSLEKLQALGSPTGNAKKPNDAQGAPIGNKFEGTREQALSDLNDPRNAAMNSTDRKNITDAINDYFNRLPAGRTGTPTEVVDGRPSLAVRTGSYLSMDQRAEIEKSRTIEEDKAQIAEASKRREGRDADWKAKNASLTPFADENLVASNDSKYKELLQIVSNPANKEIFGQLYKYSGPIYAVLAVAEKGIQTPVGSLSLDAEDALKALLLTPEQRGIARNVTQILSDLNQTVMRAGKDIYGPQIAAFEAKKMAEPGFQNSDPASFIKYLAQKHKITNEYMGMMANEREKYFEAKPNATSGSFYTSDNYKKIVREYQAVYTKLVLNSPYR
jgi:hypothetical protein